MVASRIVLVIEDHAAARETIALALHIGGIDVVEAENGRAAIDYLERTGNIPCLILCDIAMPVMNGVAFLRWKAQQPSLTDVPVVVVTADASELDQLSTAYNACITKPCDLDVVTTLAHGYVQRAGLQQSPP